MPAWAAFGCKMAVRLMDGRTKNITASRVMDHPVRYLARAPAWDSRERPIAAEWAHHMAHKRYERPSCFVAHLLGDLSTFSNYIFLGMATSLYSTVTRETRGLQKVVLRWGPPLAHPPPASC